MNRYLLELQEPDGQVTAEVLYFYANGAGPVDDDGLALFYGRAVSLFGREWRVQKAELAKEFVRITCTPVTDATEQRVSSHEGGPTMA